MNAKLRSLVIALMTGVKLRSTSRDDSTAKPPTPPQQIVALDTTGSMEPRDFDVSSVPASQDWLYPGLHRSVADFLKSVTACLQVLGIIGMPYSAVDAVFRSSTDDEDDEDTSGGSILPRGPRTPPGRPAASCWFGGRKGHGHGRWLQVRSRLRSERMHVSVDARQNGHQTEYFVLLQRLFSMASGTKVAREPYAAASECLRRLHRTLVGLPVEQSSVESVGLRLVRQDCEGLGPMHRESPSIGRGITGAYKEAA